MSQFNPEMLILARESRGLTQTQLAGGIAVQQGTVSKVEAGLLLPSVELIAKLAEFLDYPPEFFNLTDRIYGFNSAVFFHRKRQAMPDRILRRLHAFMNLTRMRVSRLLRASEISPEASFRRMEVSDYRGGADEIAQLVRATWQAPLGPIRNVTEAIENAGGVVVRMDFGTRHADAISEWVPGYPPIFLVNSDAGIPGDRLRMTLAHEIAHVIMHRFPNPDMEEQANTFAAEFLMPRKQIKASLYSLTIAKLVQLKKIWKVSMAALIYRAHELGTITESQRKYLYFNMAKKGYRVQEPAGEDVPVERPSLLSKLSRIHLEELGYSFNDLKNLLLFRGESDMRAVYLGIGNLKLVG
jgi:Zn-dependent peptidase ImmA (M78 family)/transcriptional regulator with XRE-family HTH domain